MNIQLPIEPIENAIEKAVKPLKDEIKTLKEMLQNNILNTPDIQEILLTDVEVAKMLGIGKSTVWHKAKNDPVFPKPVKIGNATRWSKKKITQYIEEKNQENKI